MLKTMNQFQIYGENNQYVIIQLGKIHGFPHTTSHSGGYDTESSLKLKVEVTVPQDPFEDEPFFLYK